MDIYPSKAQFSTNETVTLCLICDDVLPISVHIRVLLLSKTVWEQNIVLTENKTTVSIGAFSATFAGYGVNVYQQNDLENQFCRPPLMLQNLLENFYGMDS